MAGYDASELESTVRQAAHIVEKDPLIGGSIDGKIEIRSLLGRGGMGTVYEGFQTGLQIPVAVKVLHADLITSTEVVRRFQAEARIASSLQHRNLVTINQFGLLPGDVPYIVMEKIDGTSLSDYLKQRGKLAAKVFYDIFDQVCKGLKVAHQKSIVHRDIKPSNIILVKQPGLSTQDGVTVKVADFGIAKALLAGESAIQQLTRTGEVIGTPIYMSPEQCTGQQVDQRSDIYALGCVMYQCLAGRPPFEADTAFELMMKHLNEAPEEPSILRSELSDSGALIDVVMKCLQKDPALRPQSVEDLAQQLAVAKNSVATKPKRTFKIPKVQKKQLIPAAVLIVVIALTTLMLQLKNSEQAQADRVKDGQNALERASRSGNPEDMFEAAEIQRSLGDREGAKLLYGKFLVSLLRDRNESNDWILPEGWATEQGVEKVVKAARSLDELQSVGIPDKEYWFRALNALNQFLGRGDRWVTEATSQMLIAHYDYIKSKAEAKSNDRQLASHCDISGSISRLFGDRYRILRDRAIDGETLPNTKEEYAKFSGNMYAAAKLMKEYAKAIDHRNGESKHVTERSHVNFYYASFLLEERNYAAAEQCLKEAIEARDWPEKGSIRLNLSNCYKTLGYAQVAEGKLNEALLSYWQAGEYARKESKAVIAKVDHDFALACIYAGNYEKAKPLLKEAIALGQASPDIHASRIHECQAQLAYCLLQAKQPEQIGKLLEPARKFLLDHQTARRKVTVLGAWLAYIDARLSEDAGSPETALIAYKTAMDTTSNLLKGDRLDCYFLAMLISSGYKQQLAADNQVKQIAVVQDAEKAWLERLPIEFKSAARYAASQSEFRTRH